MSSCLFIPYNGQVSPVTMDLSPSFIGKKIKRIGCDNNGLWIIVEGESENWSLST